jgi:hypothetical protein
MEMSPTLSLLRLAQKMHKLSLVGDNATSDPFKIVVIGGSMTTGFTDYTQMNVRELAWPHKLLDFMHLKWSHPDFNSVEIINLATGGANEDYWIGNIDIVSDQGPILTVYWSNLQ